MGATEDAATRDLLGLYDQSVDDVYGYLLHRCGDRAVAEDITSETFLAAARLLHDEGALPTVAWLIAVARNKLVDHWRRQARADTPLDALDVEDPEPPWEEDSLDQVRTATVLRSLGPHHRTALVLRYFDDLPTREVARLIARTEHATEALLVRARSAFRRAYEQGKHDG